MTGVTPPLPGRYADPVLIGAGGMAVVYRATDVALGRPVAVKVLAAALAADDDHRRRFAREARAAARIRSPHVVAIYDVGERLGRPYIVMELVSGGTLAERRSRGPVALGEAIGWIEQAAAAIDAAHAQGVVHRDLTPSNLMLTPEGTLKVVDFGIARVLEGDASTTITGTGMALGTAGYLSPEQARGERVGPASDVYSLGIVAFELVTGGRPCAGRSAPAEMAARLREPPPRASERRPGLPPEVDAVLARALSVSPAERQASAGRLARELAVAAASGASAAAAPTDAATGTAPIVPEVRGRPRRWPVATGVAAVAAVAGVLVAVGAGAFDGDGEGPPAPAPAGAAADAGTASRQEPATTARPQASAGAPRPAAAPTPATTAARPVPSPRGKGKRKARPKAVSFDRAQRMTDDAWAEIRRGRPEKAVRLMERAVPALAGSGDLYEGYAYYNLGRGLLDLGACEAAIPYLEASLDQRGSRAQLAERDEMLGRAEGCAGSGDDEGGDD
ncbi:MAG TPA: serine/threonine-protein kinase [Miltoncostaeaceae bacterium]|nr:serine/threonine-protein kinase [Miltoncostaeaceae bacterium]